MSTSQVLKDVSAINSQNAIRGWEKRRRSPVRHPAGKKLSPYMVRDAVALTLTFVQKIDAGNDEHFCQALKLLCSAGVMPSEIASRIWKLRIQEIVDWSLGEGELPSTRKRARILEVGTEFLTYKGYRYEGRAYDPETGTLREG